MTIAREGNPVIFSVLFVSVVILGTGIALSSTVLEVVGCLGLFLNVLILFFFREPEFEAICGDREILAPADGKVIALDNEVPDNLSGYSTRLSIFLSIFDCHVNWIPATGQIEDVRFKPGRWFSAFKPEASLHNQRSEIDLVTPHGRIHFRQISGSVARRVVYSLEPGQSVGAGQRFGVMRFGSRIDMFLPPHVNVKVAINDKVKGGKSVVGEFNQ